MLAFGDDVDDSLLIDCQLAADWIKVTSSFGGRRSLESSFFVSSHSISLDTPSFLMRALRP